MTQTTVTAQLLSDLRMQFKHLKECSGTRKTKDGGSKMCPSCENGVKLFARAPLHILSQILSEPVYPARVEMVTLIVDSTFRRGTHNTKRSRADLAAGMQLLKDYKDNGGKLRTSTPLSL